jgi:hypothetical protein
MTQVWRTGLYFDDMYTPFYNLSYGQKMEIIFYNIASNSLRYKLFSMNMHQAELQGNDPLVLQQAISMIWQTIWFTNVYYEDLELTA